MDSVGRKCCLILIDLFIPYLSDVHLQAFCISLADEEILSGQRFRSTRVYVISRARDRAYSNF